MSRRYGEGSVFQRGEDGRWVAETPVAGQTAHRSYGATRKEALAKRAAYRTAAKAAADPPTVAAWLATWQAAQAPTWRPRTTEHYAMLVRVHLVPALGHTLLPALTAAACRSWLAGLATAGTGQATRHGAYRVLRAALRAAVRAEVLDRSPLDAVTPPKPAPPAQVALSAAEALALLATAEGTRWAVIVRLALLTGLRQGEILGLRWSDVDLDRGRLTVSGALTGRTLATFTRQAPKTAKSARTLPLSPSVVAALTLWRQEQATERRTVGLAWLDTLPDLVATTHYGTPYNGRNVGRTLHGLCRAAGVPVVRVHALRHTACTLMLDAGVPVHVVQAQLGHTTPGMVLTVYAHSNLAAATDLAGRMETVLGPRVVQTTMQGKETATNEANPSGNGDHDLLLPKQALYQTELCPDA